MIKINMGCGWRNFGNDWIHIDGGDYKHLNHNNICELPYENNTVDLIYASHVIEYFDRNEVEVLLKEWKRVLKNKGVLRISVPNFAVLSDLYKSGILKLEGLLGPLYGKMNMAENSIYHKTVYDFDSLKNVLNKCGFKNVDFYDWRHTCHSEYDDHSQAYIPHMDKENGTLISLNVECIKK